MPETPPLAVREKQQPAWRGRTAEAEAPAAIAKVVNAAFIFR